MPSATDLLGTPSAFFGSIVFGGIGLICMAWGKSTGQGKTMIIAGLLMGYTFFVENGWAIWSIGSGLCALLYFWREQ